MLRDTDRLSLLTLIKKLRYCQSSVVLFKLAVVKQYFLTQFDSDIAKFNHCNMQNRFDSFYFGIWILVNVKVARWKGSVFLFLMSCIKSRHDNCDSGFVFHCDFIEFMQMGLKSLCSLSPGRLVPWQRICAVWPLVKRERLVALHQCRLQARSKRWSVETIQKLWRSNCDLCRERRRNGI